MPNDQTKPNTVYFFKDRIRQLINFDKLKNAPIDKIDEQMVAEYVQWRGRKLDSMPFVRKRAWNSLTRLSLSVSVASTET